MKALIEIDMTGDAFKRDLERELARVLTAFAAELAAGPAVPIQTTISNTEGDDIGTYRLVVTNEPKQ